jgi:hypothetical protein
VLQFTGKLWMPPRRMKEETRETEDPREEMIKAQKKFCSWAMTSAIIVAFVFLILDEKAIAKGLVLGTLFSIVNFVLLGRSIPTILGQSVAKTRAIGLTSILSRYALLAVPLIVGVKSDTFNFIAVVVGIFAVQIVTVVNYTIIKRFFSHDR